MKLSRKGDYALRAMVYLSLNYDKNNIQINEISREENIPEKFLEQILLELKNAGFLKSRRGIGGGYSLIKDPKEINLAQVIRIIDGPLAPLNCVSTWAYVSCNKEKDCGLYNIMLDVRNAIAKILEGITFADICKRTRDFNNRKKKNKFIKQ